MKISVLGLGRLGLPFSFFLSSKGHNVFGYDKIQKIGLDVKKNKKNFEPKLNSYIKKFKKNFSFKNNLEYLILNTDISFLVLPTQVKRMALFQTLIFINV